MAHEVFISYSTTDKAVADRVCVYLEEQGISCWIAPRDIFGGQDFGAAITEAIQACRIVVLIFSASANISKQIVREIKLAVDHEKTVVPIRLDKVPIADTFAYFLSAVQWLEAMDGPREGHLQRLANTLRSHLNQPPEPAASTFARDSAATARPGRTLGEQRSKGTGRLRRYGPYGALATAVLLAAAILGIRNLSPATGKSKVNPDDGERYIYISPGSFRMGCSEGDRYCYPNENPARDVHISKGYWMQQTEATVGSYRKFCERTGKPMPTSPKFSQADNHPVVNINWNEADTYCKGAGGRLPTEAEWEYAARAGVTAPQYGELDRIAWYGKNSKGGTHPSATRSPNQWGLYDMLGNVWEWCNDWYADKYDSANPVTDPQGPATGQMRVLRGAAWDSEVWNARASDRGAAPHDLRQVVLGFRCVRDVMP